MCVYEIQICVSYVLLANMCVNENFLVLELINVLIILHENCK